MDNTAKLEFGIWLQYKGPLASYIQAAAKPNSLDRPAKKEKLLRVFAYHLHALGLDHAVPQSQEVVWGTGQMRAYWKLDMYSLQWAQMRSSIGIACNNIITECPITSISSFAFKEPNISAQVIRVKGYSTTSHDISITSLSPVPSSRVTQMAASSGSSSVSPNALSKAPFPPLLAVPVATTSSSASSAVSKATPVAQPPLHVDAVAGKMIQGLSGNETTSQVEQRAALHNTNKRKLEDESTGRRAKLSKRTTKPVTALPTHKNNQGSPKILSNAPKFVIPPPLTTPSDNHLFPHIYISTQYDTPYESYTIPSKSFQEYRVDMSGISKTLLVSIQRHLGKTRTQLADMKEELLEERKKRQKLEEELEDRTELVPQVSQPVVLPISPPHSPTSEGISNYLVDAGQTISREAPMAHGSDQERTNEGPPLEKSGRDILSNNQESMAARIQQLEELLRQQRAAWEATEQERIVLQNLLISERREHIQAERESDPLRGIPSATVPAFVAALDKLAQLTDKIAV